MMQQIKCQSVTTKLAFLNTALRRILSERPDSLAVCDGDNQLTYQQLYDITLEISRQFNQAGLLSGQRLVLDGPRSDELFLMVVACLLSGISFISVPGSMTLEQKYQFAIQNGCVGICSFSSEFSELRSFKVGAWQLWLMPSVEDCDLKHDEVYCVRTSGTTGEPKLVPICVAQLDAFLQNCHSELAVPAGIHWSWNHDLSFDFSIWELFGSLSHGGCLVVISEQAKRDPALALDILKKDQVHLLSVTPSEFRYLFATRSTQLFNELALQTVVFCGEKLTSETLRPFFAMLVKRKVRVFNTYGPSEATVFCSAWRVSTEDFAYDVIPIGKPFPNMTFSLQEGSAESSGNLILQGSQVFSGYEGREPLTSGYLTGDICRRDNNGVWHYIGRKEGYYKINGFRVDPLEIEEFLQSVPGVCEAVVWLEEAAAMPSLLKACVNVMPDVTLTTRELRRACTKMSPWLRPAHFLIVPQSEWPMNARGKTDRAEIKRRYCGS